jgi:hypothetical protein
MLGVKHRISYMLGKLSFTELPLFPTGSCFRDLAIILIICNSHPEALETKYPLHHLIRVDKNKITSPIRNTDIQNCYMEYELMDVSPPILFTLYVCVFLFLFLFFFCGTGV